MTPEVRKDEESGFYELGAEIDGAWIVFASTPVSSVESAVETAKQNQQQPEGQ